ncbi:unnamed protein product, partial [Discosporangium mesarthrocarpum]
MGTMLETVWAAGCGLLLLLPMASSLSAQRQPLTTFCGLPKPSVGRTARGRHIDRLVARARPRTWRGVKCLRCELTRLSAEAGRKLLPTGATSDQWAHYWGATEMQRVGKLFEVSTIAFLGLWACYFTSFFIGVGATSVIGTAFAFYWLLAPNVNAFRRNQALGGGLAPYPGAEGKLAALFSARVISAREEFNPVTGKPVYLRLVIEDSDGRALKFRTSIRPEYTRIRPGMRSESVLVSLHEDFEIIAGVSDTFIPAADVWVGDYPFLDKVNMRRILAHRYAMRSRRGGRREAGPGQGREGGHQQAPLRRQNTRSGVSGGRPEGHRAQPSGWGSQPQARPRAQAPGGEGWVRGNEK